jgi:hypothetical protein
MKHYKSLWVWAEYYDAVRDARAIARVPAFHAGAPTRWMWFEPENINVEREPLRRCAVLKVRPATLDKIEYHLYEADCPPFRTLRAHRVGNTALMLERALSQCAVDVSFATSRQMRTYFDELRVMNTLAEWTARVPNAIWCVSTTEPVMPNGQFVFPFHALYWKVTS